MVPEGHRFACLVFRHYHPRPQLDSPVDLGNGLLAHPKFPVELNKFWRETLGTIEVDQIENASFVLVSSEQAENVYDANDLTKVKNRVQFLHWALVLVANISSYLYCVLLSGGHGSEGLKVLGRDRLPRIYGTDHELTQSATTADLHTAVTITVGIEQLSRAQRPNGDYGRLASGLDAFITGIRSPKLHVRMHQFVRAIEAFVPPEAQGADKFAKHIKTFLNQIGPSEPIAVLKEMYRLRNASEHHRDLGYALQSVTGTEQEQIAKCRVEQSETICRTQYQRALSLDDSNRRHWISEDSIRDFWNKTESEQRQILGEPFNV